MKHDIRKYDDYIYEKILDGSDLRNQDFMFNEIFKLVEDNKSIDSYYQDNNVCVLMRRFVECLKSKHKINFEPNFFHVVTLDNKKIIITNKYNNYVKFETFDNSIVRKLKKQYKLEEIKTYGK